MGDDLDVYRWGRLDIPSRPECVPAVRRIVERLGTQAGLSPSEIDDMDLAVTEACANAIRHGSPDRERNVIHVTFYVRPGAITVEIRDQGRGFDPNSKRAPAPSEWRDGGYGLLIMRRVVDDFQLGWRDGTVVRLGKRRCIPTGPGPLPLPVPEPVAAPDPIPVPAL